MKTKQTTIVYAQSDRAKMLRKILAHFRFQRSKFVLKTVNLSLVFTENQHQWLSYDVLPHYMMPICPIVHIQLSFVQFSLLCYVFCILSKTECKSIYFNFRYDHESSSFQKLAGNKCREINGFVEKLIFCFVVNLLHQPTNQLLLSA